MLTLNVRWKKVKNSSDRGDNTSCTEKQEDHIPCSFAYKVVYVDDEFRKSIVLYRGEDAAYMFNKVILKEYLYCRIEKKTF